MSKTPALSNQRKAELALARFRPLESGDPPLTYAALADAFNAELPQGSAKLTAKAVERAIGQAFEEHWVYIHRTNILPDYTPNEDLQDKLVAAFWDYQRLRKAIVVDIDVSQIKSDLSRGGDPVPSDNDIIHGQLGHAAASMMAKSELFRTKNDIVAVASGRAVHAVIGSLQQFKPFQVDEITLMSLTGSLFFQQTQAPTESLLDADIHTALLAQRFAGRVHTLPTSLPIAHDSALLEEIKRGTPLGQGYHPTVAIIGVGILAEGHRFCQVAKQRRELQKEYDALKALSERKAQELKEKFGAVKALNEREAADLKDKYEGVIALYDRKALDLKDKMDSLVLQPIHEDLQELIEFTEKIGREHPGYNPVADMCNRLFFVPPPPSYKMDDHVRRQIEGKIERINACLLTATKTEIDAVGTVILIAGTTAKARAIFKLLIHKPPKIDILCVDSETAKALLRLVKDPLQVKAIEPGADRQHPSRRT